MSERTSDEKPAAISWNSPGGLDLNPRPPQAVRISRRTSLVLVAVGLVLLGLFAYGGWKRRQRQSAALADRNIPKHVAPATAAAAGVVKDVPAGNMAARTPPVEQSTNGQLLPPEQIKTSVSASAGQPETIYVRQPPTAQTAGTQAPQVHQPTPEERYIQAAYEAQERAMAAPTAIRQGFGRTNNPGVPSAVPDASGGPYKLPPPQPENFVPREGSAGDLSPQEAFLKKTRSARTDDYLKATRTAPISKYEIKAGWEIPAVMEQAVNSDLPGEVKALVTSNVYDTATGRYLLVPQGSRLIGEYNSQIGYGQNAVQVVWNRLIYPDGSSLDLGGMLGQDENGSSGFRGKVDHHYKRLLSFAVLTSLFAAASEVSQNRNRAVLVYPSPGEVAGSAVGQQVSDLGAQVMRKNLNIQPTIKIPAGYRFNVRVDRDIAFDGRYRPSS